MQRSKHLSVLCNQKIAATFLGHNGPIYSPSPQCRRYLFMYASPCTFSQQSTLRTHYYGLLWYDVRVASCFLPKFPGLKNQMSRMENFSKPVACCQPVEDSDESILTVAIATIRIQCPSRAAFPPSTLTA